MSLTIEDIKKFFGNTEEKITPEVEILFELKSVLKSRSKEFENRIIPKETEDIIKQEFLQKKIKEKVEACKNCSLVFADCHTNKVPGEGCLLTPLMLIGEAPGFDEDRLGRPFVGKAGQLLTRVLNKSKIDRKRVYITNIIKCRPPNNRNPFPKEISACKDIIEMEIELIKPKVIIALGATALKFFKEEGSITRDRGKWLLYKDKIPVMPTFHPAYLLRQQGKHLVRTKWEVWEDFQAAIQRCKELEPNYPFFINENDIQCDA